MIISVTVIIIDYYGFNVMIVKPIRGVTLHCFFISQKTNASQCQHMRVPTEHDDRKEGKKKYHSFKPSQSSYSCCNCNPLFVFLKLNTL